MSKETKSILIDRLEKLHEVLTAENQYISLKKIGLMNLNNLSPKMLLYVADQFNMLEDFDEKVSKILCQTHEIIRRESNIPINPYILPGCWCHIMCISILHIVLMGY